VRWGPPRSKGRRPRGKLDASGRGFVTVAQLCSADVDQVRRSRRVVATTTCCAVLLPVLIGPYALLAPHQMPHTTFLMLMVIDALLLGVEVQQFAIGAASGPNWNQFVVAERDFLGHPEPLQPTGLLHQSLAADICLTWTARRLRQVYLLIFSTLLIGWLLKLNNTQLVLWNPAEMLDRAAIGAIAGWITCGAVMVFYTALTMIAVLGHDPDKVVGDPLGGFGPGDHSWQ
jgi:uncharacterized membrane protein